MKHWLVLILALVTLPALAEPGTAGMTDPMRPAVTTKAAEPVDGDAVAAAPQVEAVRISRGSRLALIGGQTYRVGDVYQGGLISRITESGVWVKSASGEEQLSLFPAVEKKMRSNGVHKKR